MTEYEMATIALALWRESAPDESGERLGYLESVKVVRKAHGMLPEQISLSELKEENNDLQDRIDYLLGAPGLSSPDAKKIILKIQALEASNQLLRHWIKIISDPEKLKEKQYEFKEFLDSIHVQEEKTNE